MCYRKSYSTEKCVAGRHSEETWKRERIRKEEWIGRRLKRDSPELLTLVQHRVSMEQRRREEEEERKRRLKRKKDNTQ